MFKYLKSNKKEGDPKKKDKEITLLVENKSLQEPFVAKVSRNALVKHSPVFKTMAENGGLKKSREVRLKSISSSGLQKLLEFITTGSVSFQSHTEVIETLKVAYVYQVSSMNEVCTNFLITALDDKNVCDIYEFAASYSHPQVEYHCLRFIDACAEEVLQSPAFMTLKKITVEDIVRRQSLSVSSEIQVFRAVLNWGVNECMRHHGTDSDHVAEVFGCVRPLLEHVRFAAMPEEELCDSDVVKFYQLLSAEDPANKRRSTILQSEEEEGDGISGRTHSVEFPPALRESRGHAEEYVYDVETAGCDVHAVRNGETFCLGVEVLKGRVFVTGVTLAFERFVTNKGNSCLYVAISATNVKTAEQVSARGAFMTSDEEAAMMFPCPLVVRDSESVEIALSVKRAINVCSVLIKSESQITVSGRKDVALRITPSSAGGRTERSMFKGIKYFY